MRLVFLKLGGSLITDKTKEQTPRLDVLNRLADEIAAARHADPDQRLVLGHGSGSFAHVPARKYGTRQGVQGADGWHGFVQVWRAAAALHRLALDALERAGLPAISFPPSATVWMKGGLLQDWDMRPIEAALSAGLLPVVYGDVAFDAALGGTILSTEDLFDALAVRITPQLVLQAGLEPGVWKDFPACTEAFLELTPETISKEGTAIGGSATTDVTGGMIAKVRHSLRLVERYPGLQVRIFSGYVPGNVQRALAGEPVGTLIHSGR